MPDALSMKARTRITLAECVDEIAQRVDNPAKSGLERFVGLEYIETGDTVVRSWGSTNDVNSSMKVFRAGDVIVARRNVYLRRAARADFDGVCSGDGIVLRAKSEVCLADLLPFLLNTGSFWNYVTSQADGTMSKRITVQRLLSYQFALPPIEEQRRMAVVLQAMEAVIGTMLKAKDLAWSTNLASYEAAMTAADSHWESATIGQALQIENRGRKPLSSIVRAGMQGEFPYYGATGKLDSISEYRFEGTYALIGEDGDHFLKYNKQSMTQLVSGRFNVNNHAHVIAGTAKCLTEWFYHYYRYRDVRPWLAKQGSGRLKLKKATLEEMPIALPPIDEQRTIIERLKGCADAGVAIEKRIRDSRVVQRQLLGACLGDG